jgi:hypothetical protein
MASTFFRSVRSLEADNSQRSYLGLALAVSLLGAWTGIYGAVTRIARLAVGQTILLRAATEKRERG